MSAPGHPRVLLLHNRYRFEGGEERSVALQLRALAAAGIEHRLLERDSARAEQGLHVVGVHDDGRELAHRAGHLLLAGPAPHQGGRRFQADGLVRTALQRPVLDTRALERAQL